MSKNNFIIILITALAFSSAAFFVYQQQGSEPIEPEVNNFQECVEAGYVIMESYPRQCKTPAGKTFVEELSNKEKAEIWIKNNAPTYIYDGKDLKFIEERGLDLVGCEDCYEYEFEFTSMHGGYGDREGEMVTQVLTDHTIVVTVENGEVTKVVTDNKFNEMTGEMVE